MPVFRRVALYIAFFITLASILVLPTVTRADEKSDAAAKAQAAIDKSLAYLKSQQKPDGTWLRSNREPPAISGIVLRCFAADPKLAKAEFVKKGFDALLSMQKDNGGIYKDQLANYNTAVSISALVATNDPAYKDKIDKAVAFLKSVQWQDTIEGPGGAKIDVNHPWFGGWGYGQGGRDGGRPDLSNTAVVLESLHDAGLKQDDPTVQRALKFVSRMQNNSETNNLKWSGNDGGFVYGIGPDGQANSAAGEYEEAGKHLVRSYGSMTYSGLKSMIYAGLDKQDPRVKAAWDWIARNWTLDENPGMRNGPRSTARAGVFYYYQVFGKALNTTGQATVTDSAGKQHDWRIELIERLSSLQNADGSFVGEKNWMEDNPILSTAMATLALQDAVADLKK